IPSGLVSAAIGHFFSMLLQIFCAGLLVGLLSLGVAGCSKSPSPSASVETKEPQLADRPPATPWFEEVAAKANFNFRHFSGHKKRFYMPEMETGGVGLLDYDADGLLDIYCVNCGALDPAATNRSGNRLYRNLGNWRFEDVTERAGVG